MLENLSERCESILEEIGCSSRGNVHVVKEISKENIFCQQDKVDLMNTFKMQVTRRLYLEHLSKERTSWPDVNQTDEELKASREERLKVKNKLEEEKDKVYSILQKVSDEYRLLQEKVIKIEEKLKIFKSKKQLFENRLKLDAASADSAVAKCEQAIVKLELEKTKRESMLLTLENEIACMKAERGRTSSYRNNSAGETTLDRLQSIVQFLEDISGLTVCVCGAEQVLLKFVPKTQELTSPEDTLSLEMTLTFNIGCHGVFRLADVKISLDHFVINDIIDTAIATNDLQYLILSAQERWTRHFPLLSEMEILTKNHAIDWIQNQCKLRVLVGKCGNTMFTLNVPKDYPAVRGITLLDTYGIEQIDIAGLPDAESTLLQWVLYLEDNYGDY